MVETAKICLLIAIGLILLPFLLPQGSLSAQSPQSDSLDISSQVPGPPPTQAAVIEQPSNGQHFTQSLIAVSGSCPNNTTVEIQRNSIFAGSVNCSNGNFSLQIQLVAGSNTLVAKVKDSLDQYGPDSSPVTVFYDLEAATPPIVVSASPDGTPSSPAIAPSQLPAFSISTDAVYRGVFVDKPMRLRIEIIGGVAPYALTIEWGDSTRDLLVRSDSGPFYIEHIYHTAGPFQIKISGSDSANQKAFIQTTAIINGQPTQALLQDPFGQSLLELILTIVSLIVATLVIFWLGYRATYHKKAG